MRVVTMLLLGASSVSAVPLFLRSPSTLISEITSRDTNDTNKSNNNNDDDKVPVAGIVIGSIIGIALILCLIAYLISRDNCITRRGWFKRRLEKKQYKKTQSSQNLSPQDDEEALTKRASFTSERESIMFSRSRASSLNIAVVEDVDHSQRRLSSQVYVLRDGRYVPVDQTESEQRRGLLSGGRTNEMTEVDIASSSVTYERAPSFTSIPVIVSPPLENDTHTDQHRDYLSQPGGVLAFHEILPEDPRTHA
ncbi:hypothetical protein TSTA_074210 [Talaromyces stipitatus ATCC 10500]|uniref:Uncharacterized protein n=1 Tax=Talaromyces stipitatus (strain ATCC 10500 / CBS 375.48 / QM 6759 / NRRL 1006) TaxID=441959 RepID=B8LUU7_TALSN|nr:uncharacterized protein TSTA_074210 [Talaromyces stipitatus ATCC 10500]EED24039.1 hypothetical protein TSTA_074210 [Talaromyces stipitatus ATCC 10500]